MYVPAIIAIPVRSLFVLGIVMLVAVYGLATLGACGCIWFYRTVAGD
jgi:hypothetical protein